MSQIDSIVDFGSALKEELVRRQEFIPSYSLRAFARDLNISASTLCEVIAGKHAVSTKMARHIVNLIVSQSLDATHLADVYWEDLNSRMKLLEALVSELFARKNRNGNYSLRAFARDLDVSAATLSCVMSGRRDLSKRLAQRIKSRLDY